MTKNKIEKDRFYGVKKGAWSREEDDKLRAYIDKHGHGKWLELPKLAGLSRCGKSCRLRWVNQLRPGVKHGNYSKEEEDLIINLRQQLGNRWSRIAADLPGRTGNEIKNYWHNHINKRTKNPQNQNSASMDKSSASLMVAAAPSSNIIPENALTSHICGYDFWSQAFVADEDWYRSPSLDDEQTLFSYVKCYEDSVDLYYQVMQEIHGNYCTGSCFI